jgi:nitrite reductase (NADH) small subunit
MARIKVASLQDLIPGALTEVEVDGTPYALCNVDGKLHCIDGICPHAGGPLGQGNLHGNRVVCPWHAWEFDCRTGLIDSDDDAKVETYPVIVENSDIFLDLP